ncbi:hypothetical protein AbraCBS73388_001764 [Aspergillus brasiliensis]|uniref:Cyanovirin-N domain-containing protein n=1 Tax=Aspergillus brasiliensis TaxID=319629 RepID=A0A9W5YZU9_9EURO|nr:hypothetical protein AbraCBS73388_001764 [Aspergillus brasiliensis]
MVFSSTSTNIYLREEQGALFLCAMCKIGKFPDLHLDLDSIYSEISLDKCLGLSSDGKFDITNSISNTHGAWIPIIKPGTLYLKGTVLYLTLCDDLGGHDLSICLDVVIENQVGFLSWKPPGYCLGNDGQLHYSELPLDDHIGAENGIIKREKNGHFLSSGKAKNVCLGSDWWVYADIKFDDGRWNPDCCIEFGKYVHIEDGKFVMDDPPGLFALRGPVMQFLEDIPLMGYGVALIDELEGDDDEAKRAVAECTYSTLITAGAVVGFALTGPIGASIGSAFGTMLGLEAKAGIGLSINDPKMRNQVASISVWQMLTQVALIALALPMDMVVAGLTEGLTEGVFEDGIVDRALQTAISRGDEKLSVYGLKTVGKDEAKEILGKIADLIRDDLAQKKSNEEIAADISKLYGDDDGDGTNPLNDTTLWVKKAVKAAANKAFNDAAVQIEEATRDTPHDAAQSALQEAAQEATQEVAKELGQEVAQELVKAAQQSEWSWELENLTVEVDFKVVGYWVETIKQAADHPWVQGDVSPGDPLGTFMGGLPAIQKALKDAPQMVKDGTTHYMDYLENAKATAQKPFQGTAEVAAEAAKNLARNISDLVSDIRALANEVATHAIQEATGQINEAMQQPVLNATQAIKQQATECARRNAQNIVKEAVDKAVQKVKDAEQEVQTAVQNAISEAQSKAFSTLVVAATDASRSQENRGTPNWDDVEDAAQGAVPGVVQEAIQSIQTTTDTALQEALQKLQPGPEAEKAVRKAAQDAREDAVSKIPKSVQDYVADAVEQAKRVYNRPFGEDPHPKSHGMQPGGVKPV